MEEYRVTLSEYIEHLNQSISSKPEPPKHEIRHSNRDVERILRKRNTKGSPSSHPEHVARIQQRILNQFKRVDDAITSFLLALSETIPEGEIILSGDLQVLQLNLDGLCERIHRNAFEVGVQGTLISSVQALEDFVDLLADRIDPRQWFTLELFITDEKGPVTVQPREETVNKMLRKFMDIISKHYQKEVIVIKIDDAFMPTNQRKSTVAIHNFDRNEVSESRTLLDVLRKQRNLAPARVIDNFRKANIYDGKRNVVLIGLTKSRKSGTANDIIRFLAADAPTMVFLEERAFSHTSKVRCFEVKDTRVWDTPGLDDQVGRGRIFGKKVCNLLDSLAEVNVIYLCLKDASDLSPNLLAPVRDVIGFLTKNVRGRVRIAFTKSEKLESIDRLAVRLNAHHAGLESNVQIFQATRNATDYSLHEQVQTDLSLRPVAAGYLTRTLEMFEELSKSGSDLDESVKREVSLSLKRLEERIRISSSLNSTEGVVFCFKRDRIEVKSFSRVIHNPSVIPKGAKLELVVFLVVEKRFSNLGFMRNKLKGNGNYEKLEQYISRNELVLLDRITEPPRFDSLFSSSETCAMLMVPMRDVVTKNLLHDVEHAVRYFSYAKEEADSGQGRTKDTAAAPS